jgi:hypothetical protein
MGMIDLVSAIIGLIRVKNLKKHLFVTTKQEL